MGVSGLQNDWGRLPELCAPEGVLPLPQARLVLSRLGVLLALLFDLAEHALHKGRVVRERQKIIQDLQPRVSTEQICQDAADCMASSTNSSWKVFA